MEDNRNDAEFWKHGIIRSTNKMFRNTECVFVEYHDCLHLTGLIVLRGIQESCKDVFGIDLDQISLLDTKGLLQWYVFREHRNFLIDLWDKSKPIPFELLDAYLAEQFKADALYQIPFSSVISDLLVHTIEFGVVKNVVVYADEVCDGIKKDVYRLLGESATVVGGDLPSALSEIPMDTTYIFSDFEKVITLSETGHLDGAAVLLPSNYRYNYIRTADEVIQPVVNLDYLSTVHRFSLGYVDLSG